MTWTCDLWTDIKALRTTRGTALAAIVTLALGTGANTAVLAVAYGVLLRPLPFSHPDQLVRIGFSAGRAQPGIDEGAPLRHVAEWRSRARVFAGLAGYAVDRMTVRGVGDPQNVAVALVEGPLFDVLAVAPEAGRVHGRNADEVVVLSDRFARRTNSSPAALLGRTLFVGGRAYAVAAVMPPSFSFPDDDVLLWAPARSVAGVPLFGEGDTRAYSLVARLAPGATLASARQDADRVLAALDRIRAQRLTTVVEPLAKVDGDVARVLALFVGASVLLLLVACANIGTLFVNQSMARSRELAVRLAIGASPGRLVRTALGQSFVVAVAGSALGVVVAKAGVAAFVRLAENSLPRSSAIEIDPPVFAAIAGIALVITVLCGTAPAFAAARTDVASVLHGGSGIVGRSTNKRIRAALVVAQVAGAVALLVGAGLFGRTIIGLLSRGAGVESDHALAMNVMLAESTGFRGESQQVLVDQILERVRGLPGVVAAGFGAGLPPNHALAMSIRMVDDRGRDDAYPANLVPVTRGYLQALGIRVRRGRGFDEADERGNEPVAVISERAARELTIGADPVGSYLTFGLPTSTGRRVKPRVIGITSDVRYSGLETSAVASVYVRWRQLPVGSAYLVVRVVGAPAPMVPVVVRAVHDVDASLPLVQARTLDSEMNAAIAGRELRFWLIAGFGSVGYGVVLVGLFAVLGRSVTERRRELAVRMAVGATRRESVSLILGAGMRLTFFGLAIGFALTLAAGRWLSSFVYGVSAYDGPTYAMVAVVVVGGALAACYVPAQRAARANPVDLMGTE